jgi:hypothetical protein
VGGSSPFFVDNDLLVALEFELSLHKEKDSSLPSSDYCYVFWTIESCLASQGVESIA